MWNPLPSKYSSYAVSINEVGQICGGAQRFKQPSNPWTVFVDDPIDGYWLLVDHLITGDPADVGEWHRGEGIENDNVPAAISEPEADTGYGFIAGYKELGYFPDNNGVELFVSRGFVLMPVPVPPLPDSQ